MKKQKTGVESSVVDGAIKSLLKEHQDHVNALKARLIESKPPAAAAEYQDDGSGYNSNGVIAQK